MLDHVDGDALAEVKLIFSPLSSRDRIGCCRTISSSQKVATEVRHPNGPGVSVPSGYFRRSPGLDLGSIYYCWYSTLYEWIE